MQRMDGCARSTEGTSVATCVPFFFHLLNYSLNMPGVFLVGFMGAGKTSVGRRLSQRLGWRFEDLDDRIVAREGQSIEQIFRESSEAAFRRAEHAALRELVGDMGESPVVVALGGGAFAQTDNLALLAEHRVTTVFLDAQVEELLRRCREEGKARPLAREEADFRRLYEERRASYLSASLCIVTAGKDVETVVEEVARKLRLDSNL